MVLSKAGSVREYLASLPAEQREVIIPLDTYPDTYNGQPLCYAGLAAHKHGYSLYLMAVYLDQKRAEAFKQAFTKAGKKLNMGRSCVRFKRLEDLPLPAIARVIKGMPPREYIAHYEAVKPPRT